MKVIGITGGIASGKSTAARYLEAQGAYLVDADRLGHRAYEPGAPAYQAVVDAFGPEVVEGDGRIDRQALGRKVFGRPEELKRLTDIVWPEIRRLAREEIEAARSEDPNRVVVVEAAVLFEAGWEDVMDEVWVVAVERDVAIRRATARDGLDEATVQHRIDAQLSNEDRAQRADLVLDNNSDPASLETQLDAALRRLVRTSAADAGAVRA